MDAVRRDLDAALLGRDHLALIVWGIGQVSGGGRRREDDPLEIARRRYAHGEITREQFEQLRHDLG